MVVGQQRGMLAGYLSHILSIMPSCAGPAAGPSKRQLGLAFREIGTQTLRPAEIDPANGADSQKVGRI
jgi:hypothetical protein